MTQGQPNPWQTFVSVSGLFALLGVLGALIARGSAIFQVAVDSTIPQNSNFYQYTFARFEPFALYTSAAFFLGLFLILRRQKSPSARVPVFLTRNDLAVFVAVGVLLATSLGRFAVYQNFDLCIDEYLNDFEVQILDHGHLTAPLPAEWKDEQNAMKVPYENYSATQGTWTSGFLPASHQGVAFGTGGTGKEPIPELLTPATVPPSSSLRSWRPHAHLLADDRHRGPLLPRHQGRL